MQSSSLSSSFCSFPTMEMDNLSDIGFSVLTNDLILPSVCEQPPLYILASVPSVDSWDCVSGELRDGGLGMLDECQPSPCSDAGYSSLHGSPVRPCSAETPPVIPAPDLGFSSLTSPVPDCSLNPLAAPASDTDFIPLATSLSDSSFSPLTSSVSDGNCTDHQLLRQRLRDTSLQQKLNRPTFNLQLLKSVSTEVPSTAADQKQQQQQVPRTPTSASWVMEQLGNVFDMALEQVHRENVSVCRSLGISPDPMLWSVDQVRAWLVFTCEQFGLPCVQTDSLTLDGPGICGLSEEELRCWLPQETADVVYAQLLVWLSSKRSSGLETSECVDEIKPNVLANLPSSVSFDLDSEDEEMPTLASVNAPATLSEEGSHCPSSGSSTGGGAGAHIHLWQFLKELLADSGEHGACIRWLDRGRGVFKIEDSVHVARLWGQRKKRPAMNYDKLSRSIRQYYKKGIMKKTERSQRLVYQFCHPYQL